MPKRGTPPEPTGAEGAQPALSVAAPTVAQLLARTELELELVTGDPNAPFRAVRHAESATHRPWLSPHDLRLSDAPFGVPRPPSDPVLWPQPSALVYGLVPKRRTLPAQLKKRAEELGLTLLTAPPAVALDKVEAAGLGLLVQASRQAAELLAAPQSHLLDALSTPKPERELLERVHRLTGAELVLLTPWGDVTARAGRGGWRPRKDQHGGSPVMLWPEGETRLGGRPAWTLKLHADGRLRGVLVAFQVTQAARPWLELCRTLLLSAALQRSAEARHDSSALSALLAEWLAGPQAAMMLEPRLAAAGVGGESPYLVAVGEVGPRLRTGRAAQARQFHQLEQMREAGEEYFRALGYGVLSETRAHHCVWVFASAAPRQHARLLLSAAQAAVGETELRMGLSLPRADLTGVADAYHQALLALQSLPGGSGLAWFDELDPVYWVLQQQPHGNLVALRDRLVGAVKEADPQGKLWRTLVAYIRSPDDLQALAAELHVHVNTLRYRLKRIEELVQEPLARPETVAKLYLALQIDAMLERGGARRA